MIAVKDAEMPRSCRSCYFGGEAYEFCPLTGNFNTGLSRPSDCPLVDMKGLVDGKKLYDKAVELEQECYDKLKRLPLGSVDYMTLNAALQEVIAWKHTIHDAIGEEYVERV